MGELQANLSVSMSQIINTAETVYPFPPKPEVLSEQQKADYISSIKQQLKENDAVMIAHYYTDPEIQALAEETGGFVGDSLEMAKFGNKHPAKTLLVAGVRFMGESAKILTPEKTVLMPTLEAECSLDLAAQKTALLHSVMRTLIIPLLSMPIHRLL